MGSEWREVLLQEVANDLTVGYVGPMASEYLPEGIPFLRSQNVEPLRINEADIKFISPAFHERIRKSALAPGDVVIVRTGKPGACAVIPDSLADANCSDLVIVRCGPKLDPRFLAYYVNSVAAHHVGSHLVGAVQQHFNVGSARTMMIRMPDLSEQRAIAHILGTLDDKIELNRRMNETLETMARALFQSWFIDFDPVRRNAARAQNQPSPQPSPIGRGSLPDGGMTDGGLPGGSISGRGMGRENGGGGSGNYRGGFDFSGLLETARALRQKQTPAETLFWELVRDRQLMGLKFRRQHQLGDYVVDFYCHERRLVVELDGGVHTSKQKKDHKRDAWMNAQGFTVLRFPNEQVLEDPQSVLAQCAEAGDGAPGSSPSGTGKAEALGSSPFGRGGGEGLGPSPLGRGGGEGAGSSPLGRGGGEGSVEDLDRLFPDSFEDSELGEIPKGWATSSLYDLATYVNGAAYRAFEPNDDRRGLPIIKIAELKAGVTAQTRFSDVQMPDKYRIDTGEILFSWSGNPDTSIDTFVWMLGPAWLNQHIFRVLPKRPMERSYVLLTLQHLRPVFAEIARNKQTTGLGHVTVEDMKRLTVVRPLDAVLSKWNALVEPLIARSFCIDLENIHLAALRDALLPKLLSGEIRVDTTKRVLGGALR